MNEIQLIEIEQRAEKATPGPWKVEASTEGDWVLDSRDDVIAGTFVQEGDADFIVHAREDVPALIAEVRRLRETSPFSLAEIQLIRGCVTFSPYGSDEGEIKRLIDNINRKLDVLEDGFYDA
ncbi:MAG: hypothetical protein IRZ03_18330 [Acidobacterium ailaaui]|nr:hypothetical protein [Pseudacidobacterium ailaaui]